MQHQQRLDPFFPLLRSVALILPLLILGAPAYAGKSLKCTDSPDPPDCLVHAIANNGYPDVEDLFKYVVIVGSTDLVTTQSHAVVKSAREAIAGSGLFEDPSSKDLTKASDDIILAAVALMAAAQHSEDPYADPTVQKLSDKPKNAELVSMMSLKLWFKAFPFGANPLGFHKILSTVMDSNKTPNDVQLDLVCDAAYYGQDKDYALASIRQLSSATNATADMKAHAASELLRSYSLDEEARQLIISGGKNAKHYDVQKGLLPMIARLRMKRHYDSAAAKLLSEYAFVANVGADNYRNEELMNDRELLQHAGAKSELKYMADEFLRYADDVSGKPYQRENLYAISSDCYLRAGEHELAISTARKGLPFVTSIVTSAVSNYKKPANTSKSELAKLAQGRGTESVVALYRAGAIKEALDTGYLTGQDRYENAARAGEKPDPLWVIDYNWPLAIHSMVWKAVESSDKEARLSVYEALLKYCTSNAECTNSGETHEQLARLAAAMGDRDKMLLHLHGAASAIDNNWYGLSAEKLVEEWLRDVQMLASEQVQNDSNTSPADSTTTQP